MLRSPFFYLAILLLFFSCQEKNVPTLESKSSFKHAVLLQKKALSNFQQNNYNSAFYYFNKSKIIFENLQDSSNVVYTLIQMANIQQINGDYYGSKETLTEALPYGKKEKDYTAAINNLFGIADKELSLYDDAIYYYKQSIKAINDPNFKQSPLNNIAVIYIKQKKYDNAIKILDSISTKKKSDDRDTQKSYSRIIDNLGYAYYKKGLPEKSLNLLNEGLKLRLKIGDEYGSIGSYLHLAEFYSKVNIQKSNEYAQKAYELATKSNSVDERLKALSLSISSNAGTQYAQKYISINDSIINIRNNFKNKFAKIKYDSKKEKDENQKLRLEKAENELALQKAQYQRIFFTIGIVGLFLLLIYLRKRYENRNRIEKIKTAYDTETRIAKDIHDELANDVFNTITFTQTQSLIADHNKDTLLQKLDQIYARVRGISRENNDIDTGINYSNNLKDMLSTYNSSKTNVLINSIEKVNWELIEDLKKITIQRILQELMVNMKKHSEASVVVVKFENSTNTIFINYSDNGKGCEKTKIIKNGLQNMENRISAIKGTITFETEPDKGFKVKITMPK